MITALLITGGLFLGIVGLALALPCEACRLRRERMRAAYARWQAEKTNNSAN